MRERSGLRARLQPTQGSREMGPPQLSTRVRARTCQHACGSSPCYCYMGGMQTGPGPLAHPNWPTSWPALKEPEQAEVAHRSAASACSGSVKARWTTGVCAGQTHEYTVSAESLGRRISSPAARALQPGESKPAPFHKLTAVPGLFCGLA